MSEVKHVRGNSVATPSKLFTSSDDIFFTLISVIGNYTRFHDNLHEYSDDTDSKDKTLGFPFADVNL